MSEASPAGQTFSYAQAAKGRSPSVPSPLPSGKALSESAETSERRISYPETKPKTIDSAKVKAEETEKSGNSDLQTGADPSSTLGGSVELKTKNIVSPKQLDPMAPPVTSSTPPSPSLGASSTSTLQKEDEILSTVNGSSDSTWDKQSQGSQNGNKGYEKVGEDKDQITSSSWNDDASQSAPLKEAPPPAINFWQHRKELQEAKAKTKLSPGLPAPKQNNTGNGNGNTSTSPKTENIFEPRKQDNKKKGKGFTANVEERSVLGLNKEGNKATEGKIRGGEEGRLIAFTACCGVADMN